MINIHKAVLYKTGIGYFERKGTIKDNKLKLNFKSGTMNVQNRTALPHTQQLGFCGRASHGL